LQALARALASAETDNKHAIARKVIIEKRKEAAERDLAQKEQQEEQDRILQARIQLQLEEERRKQERCALRCPLLLSSRHRYRD
jgi:translation initiation factor 3 subunit A